MGLAYHEVYASDGLAGFAVFDRVYLGTVNATYTGGAGTATAAVTWTEPVPVASYGVLVILPEVGVGYATSATALGFTLNVAKVAAGNLAGGTAKCIIIA